MTDGIRNVSVMVTNTNLSISSHGLNEGAKYLFHQVPYYNNTIILSKEEQIEVIVEGEHEMLPENQ